MRAVDAEAAAGDQRRGERGFTLVDTMIASVLLLVGALGAATMGVYSSNLQQRIKDYSAESLIVGDLVERMRAGNLNTVYAQYTATPISTVQGHTVTVEFPQDVLDLVYHGTVDIPTAMGQGFLPVRITVTGGKQDLRFATFVGTL